MFFFFRGTYRKVSNIRRTTFQYLNDYRLAVVFAQFIEAGCSVGIVDVVGATPTGDAPTTSEWSWIKLPTKLHLILEVWW